jgi:hypothetical protein
MRENAANGNTKRKSPTKRVGMRVRATSYDGAQERFGNQVRLAKTTRTVARRTPNGSSQPKRIGMREFVSEECECGSRCDCDDRD